jgi:hypothetical protein
MYKQSPRNIICKKNEINNILFTTFSAYAQVRVIRFSAILKRRGGYIPRRRLELHPRKIILYQVRSEARFRKMNMKLMYSSNLSPLSNPPLCRSAD